MACTSCKSGAEGGWIILWIVILIGLGSAAGCRRTSRDVAQSTERFREGWQRAVSELVDTGAALRGRVSRLPPLSPDASDEVRFRRARLTGLLRGTEATLNELRAAIDRAVKGIAVMATHNAEGTEQLLEEENGRVQESINLLREQFRIVDEESRSDRTH